MSARLRRPLAPLALVLAAFGLALALVAGGCGSSGEDAGGGTGTATSSRFAAADTLPDGLAGKPAPPISLTDARSGRAFDAAERLKGKPYLVTFLFANCPDVCPLIGQELRQSLEELGPQADGTAVVAVSVDPRGDTAEAAQTWLRRQRLPENFHYLIGSEAELSPVWRGFYAAPQIAGDPESAHTAVVWLVDAQGRLAGKVSAGMAFDPADLADDVRTLLSS